MFYALCGMQTQSSDDNSVCLSVCLSDERHHSISAHLFIGCSKENLKIHWVPLHSVPFHSLSFPLPTHFLPLSSPPSPASPHCTSPIHLEVGLLYFSWRGSVGQKSGPFNLMAICEIAICAHGQYKIGQNRLTALERNRRFSIYFRP